MSGKFPEWLRRPWASGNDFAFTKEVIEDLQLHTVCQSARCPNIGECWARRTATVMVLGNICSRNCGFCSVPSGRPMPLDADEPEHVAEAVRRMGLKHAVVTTVVRDDLEDGGAGHIAQTIGAIHRLNPDTTVEILVSDYNGEEEAIEAILDARPEVFCHNVETSRRLYPKIRDRRFDYDNTLKVLRMARDYAPRSIIKSAIMVGHGETPGEVEATLKDIAETGCDVVCIGHYLRPTKQQAEVHEFVPPERFKLYEEQAYALGFKHAVSGPFVRSSYRSEEILKTDFARERLSLD